MRIAGLRPAGLCQKLVVPRGIVSEAGVPGVFREELCQK